jgi:3-deoxy-manno-octulosonate cytidylyltransferase (CMP-KDO synthetase)
MEMLELSEKIECLRYLEFGKKIKMVESNIQGVEIDTPEDLQRAKTILRSNN